MRLLPHNAVWSSLFATEAALLRQKLGIDAAQIQHVGSTAIPGIVAKPIIDIAICVDALVTADEWAELLAASGYWNKGKQPDMPNRRFFAKGPEEKRTVYLHVVLPKEYGRLIAFRDALRANAELANEYSELKQKLASEYADNRVQYTKEKDAFISRVLNGISLN